MGHILSQFNNAIRTADNSNAVVKGFRSSGNFFCRFKQCYSYESTILHGLLCPLVDVRIAFLTLYTLNKNTHTTPIKLPIYSSIGNIIVKKLFI